MLANIVLTVEGGNSLVLHPIGMKSGSGLVRSSGPESNPVVGSVTRTTLSSGPTLVGTSASPSASSCCSRPAADLVSI